MRPVGAAGDFARCQSAQQIAEKISARDIAGLRQTPAHRVLHPGQEWRVGEAPDPHHADQHQQAGHNRLRR